MHILEKSAVVLNILIQFLGHLCLLLSSFSNGLLISLAPFQNKQLGLHALFLSCQFPLTSSETLFQVGEHLQE